MGGGAKGRNIIFLREGGEGEGGVVYAALAANTLFLLAYNLSQFLKPLEKIILNRSRSAPVLNFSDSLPSPKHNGPSLRLGAYWNKYGKRSFLESLNLPVIRFSTKVPYHLKIS